MTKRIISVRNPERFKGIDEQTFYVTDNFTGLCAHFLVSEKPIGNPPIYLIHGRCGYVVDYNPNLQKATDCAYKLALSFAKYEAERFGVKVRDLTLRAQRSVRRKAEPHMICCED